MLKLAGINTRTGNWNIAGNIQVFGNGSVIRGASNLSPISSTDISGNMVGNFINVSANVQTRSGAFFGNGASLTGVEAAGIPKQTTADIMGNITGNTVAMDGNISADYFFGDGGGLTGLVSIIPRAGNINIQGNIWAAANVDATNVSATILRVNGNLVNTDSIIATGNISANYFVGNGAQIIGVNASPPPSANLNIVGNVSAPGNVDAANVTITNQAAFGNLSVLGEITAGNVSANYLFGNAANIRTTLLPATISTDIIGNVTATGNVSANYLLGNAFEMYFAGNLVTANVAVVADQAARLALTGVPLGGLVTQVDTNTQYLLAYNPPSANTNWVPLQGTNFPVTSVFGRQGDVILVSGTDVKTFGQAPITGNGDITNANIDILYGNVIGNVLANNLVAGNIIANTVAVGQIAAPLANLAANVLIGNGFYLVGTPESLPATGRIDIQGNVRSFGFVSAANMSTNVLRITNGNLTVSNQIVVTGNVTAPFFYGNGALLVNTTVGSASGTKNTDVVGNVRAPGNVDASNVSTQLLRVNANTNVLGQIVVVGNTTASYFIGNGALITGLTTVSGNQNVNIIGNVFSTGNVNAGNITASTILRVNGNMFFAAQVNAVGNVVGNVFFGNGTFVHGIRATGTQNVNVVGNVVASGNVDAANISVTSVLAQNVIVTGNIVISPGNITADTFFGNGSFLTGVVPNLTGTRNINAVGNVQAPANVDAANISISSILRINANADIAGQVAISGNLSADRFIGNGFGITNAGALTGIQNINIIGNVTSAGNVDASNITANLVRVNGNLIVVGQVNVVNRVNANYLLGNASQISGIIPSAGVGSSFVPPGTGFASNVIGVVQYVAGTAWNITLNVSTPRFITVQTPNLPTNPNGPFTTLPANVTATLITPWSFSLGTWTGTFRFNCTSTVSSASNNFIFNYHTSFGSFNGSPSVTFCQVSA